MTSLSPDKLAKTQIKEKQISTIQVRLTTVLVIIKRQLIVLNS